MRQLRKLSFLIIIAFAVSSCAVTSSVNVSDTRDASGQEVQAEISHFNFLALFPSQNTDQLQKNLASQCPGGEVTGITTQTYARFFYIGYSEKAVATGTCVE